MGFSKIYRLRNPLCDWDNSLITREKILSIIKSKTLRNLFLWILIFVAGAALRPYLEERAKHLAGKHSAAKELSYEVSAVAHYQKFELTDVAKSHGIGFFDLKLDDPLLSDYCLARIMLRNSKGPIISPIRFQVYIGTTLAKIMDVKFKIIRPANKSMAIVHSLPNLTWTLPKVLRPTLSWEPGDAGTTAGYCVYRSFLKDRGYGRVNDKLLTKPAYKIAEGRPQNLSQAYYRVTAVSVSGWEGGLTDPVVVPDSLAFLPYFSDSVSVYPEKKRKELSEPNEFTSLSKAMSKCSRSTVYIAHKRRKDIMQSEDLSNDPRVFYDDDLEFLKGKITISLPDGIDEDGAIEFLVLYKVLPGQKSDLSMKLQGMTGISLKRLVKPQPEKVKLGEKEDDRKDIKKSLTPARFYARSVNGAIYLIWQKPKSADYKGIRIFRSKKRDWEDLNRPGKELYRGPGLSKKILCTLIEKPPFEARGIPHQIARDEAGFFQPPPTEEEAQRSGLLPPRPTGLRLVDEVGAKGELMFGDDTVSPNTIYTYTLVAFDGSYNYSYPILLNASLEGAAEFERCTIQEPDPPKKDTSMKTP